MRRALPWVALAAAMLVIGVVSRGDQDTGEALDPRSTGPLGARALVLLLEEMGADVSIAAVPPDRGVAVLLVDELGEDQTDQLRRWVVERSGTLVVTDPTSSFAPPLARGDVLGLAQDRGQGDGRSPECALAAVAGVDTIFVRDPAHYRIGAGAVGCFGNGDGRSAYLVARAEGTGTVVALGGGGPFVNEHLATADNAVLAAALMAPRPGTVVTVLEPAPAGSGRASLRDLVPAPVRRGAWQLVVAFLAVVLWRARRMGRPIEEGQPVDIPGSELVVATGHLLQHAGRRDAAAEMLRLQLRRDVAARYGLSPDAPATAIVDAVGRPGVDREGLAAALSLGPVRTDAELAAVATAIESVRREVLDV